ncbi:hypothetical protein BKA56DRAFT_117475 [Ilyonectria sp. MPI-CAGE-AT-0026]|nr:hypothetical protein BKA56DRAFT_117475 [Ilyonectria sp. MPI-CAGE-AT-0026]
MAVNPSDELWSYDKNRVILTILDMAYRSLDSECAILLEYIGVLGSWPIPLSVLEQSLFVDDQANSAPGDVVRLRKILSEPHYLRLSLRRLAKFCLIRLKEVNGLIENVTIHRILCSWSLDNMVSSNKEVLLVMATYSLGKEALMGLTPTTVRLSSLMGEIPVNRKIIAAFKDCFSTMQDNNSIRKDLDPATERFRAPISQILRFAAWLATALGNSDKAKTLFSSAIDFEIYRLSLEGKLWPEGATALELLCGLSRACKKTGDLGEATEALKSALPLSEELYGDGSDIVVTLVSFLKNISEKHETMLRHHKAVVIASTDLSGKRGADGDVRSAGDVGSAGDIRFSGDVNEDTGGWSCALPLGAATQIM